MFHPVLSTCCWELESLHRVCKTANDFNFTLSFILGKAGQDEIFLLLLLFFPCSYCWKSWLLNSGCYNRISWFVFFPESPGIGFSLTACSWSFHSAWGHRGGQTCAAINLLFVGGDVFSPAKATWLKIAWPLPCAAIWSKIPVILYAHVLLFCTTEEMGLNKAKPLLWGQLM